MAYRLKPKESVAKGVKRIAREEIQSAIQHLRGESGVSRDEAIHEARKNIKKTRAVLRLVRAELGDVYAKDAARLREVGQTLSRLRDAGALIATFDALKSRYKTKLRRRSLNSIRRALMGHKAHLEEEMAIGPLMGRLVARLRECRNSVQDWPIETDGFAAIAPGFERSFRSGRKMLARFRKHGRREDLHEWRERVKDHWYHIRLLENLWSDVMKGYEHSLKELESALGEDLNLSLLRAQIASAPEAHGSRRDIGLVERAIDGYQKALRETAMSLGRRVYASTPGRLVREMRDLWETWREK